MPQGSSIILCSNVRLGIRQLYQYLNDLQATYGGVTATYGGVTATYGGVTATYGGGYIWGVPRLIHLQNSDTSRTVPLLQATNLGDYSRLQESLYHCSLMTIEENEPPPYRTITAKTSRNTIIKPGELVDVVELTPLHLADRRIYNLMLGAAWENIDQDVEHIIRKSELRTEQSHAVGGRLDSAIGRLMGARVRVRIERDGAPYTLNMPLLETVAEPVRSDGNVYFRFPRELRKVISDSNIFARLQKDVMFALSSKYALALYEMLQKRGNLRHKTQEKFTVEGLRALLGVQTGRLLEYKNFKSRALKPAITEVNALANYGISFIENKEGKTVKTITIGWWQKTEEEMKLAFRELSASKVGRKTRIKEKQK